MTSHSPHPSVKKFKEELKRRVSNILLLGMWWWIIISFIIIPIPGFLYLTLSLLQMLFYYFLSETLRSS